MKKGFFSLMFAAMMMCFVACDPEDVFDTNGDGNGNGNGDNNNYAQMLVGTWEVDLLTLNSQDITPEDMDIVMNANGTGLLVNNGVSENNNFTWSVSGNQLTITPNSGTATYTIRSITVDDCTLAGTVVPGTDMTGEVIMHLDKDDGNDPDDPNNPDTPDANFPVGTEWEFVYDTTINMETANMLFTLTIDLDFETAQTCELDMEVSMAMNGVPIPVDNSDMTMPCTYTYNATTYEGVISASATDPETQQPYQETIPFVYDPTSNTITLNVPSDLMDGGDTGIMFPSQWVFHRSY